MGSGGVDDVTAEGTLELTRVPGRVLDPPVRDVTGMIAKLDERHRAAGITFRVGRRFIYAHIPLLAAGTAYYVFLALISLVTFAYGIFALVGAEQLAEILTAMLNNAFPGLLGPAGVSPEALRNFGTVSSVLGLLVLAFSGTGSVAAANYSLHIVFGAPKDPRNFVLGRIRMVGQMLVLGPLILASFVPSLLFANLTAELRTRLGIAPEVEAGLLQLTSLAIGLALNFLVLMMLMSWLGGIKPPARARIIGAVFGAVIIEALRLGTALLVGVSLGRPQYGAFTVPIALLLLLYLMTIAAYLAACLTAVVAIQRAEREARD